MVALIKFNLFSLFNIEGSFEMDVEPVTLSSFVNEVAISFDPLDVDIAHDLQEGVLGVICLQLGEELVLKEERRYLEKLLGSPLVAVLAQGCRHHPHLVLFGFTCAGGGSKQAIDHCRVLHRSCGQLALHPPIPLTLDPDVQDSF